MPTQEERRESTKAALMAAAVASLVDNGVGRFTTSDVIDRAGLSNGALFRYFPTRTDLLANTVQSIFVRAREDYAHRYEALVASEVTAEGLLALLWDVMSDPAVAAAYEVYAAARTNKILRAAIEPIIAEHVAVIHELGRGIAERITRSDAEAIGEAVWLAILSMQGLALSQPVFTDPYDGHQLVATLVKATGRLLDLTTTASSK
jgi:AcrR family transcriptional regulator